MTHEPSSAPSRGKSFALVAVAYLASGIAAWLVAARLAPSSPLWLTILAADMAATCVVFAFSVALNNSSVYDPYWSVAPMAIAPALAIAASTPAVPSARKWLVVALVLAWGARLTWNWARGWDGLSHEDWRYVDLRHKTGKAYWLVSFLGLHTMPTLWVYLGSLSLIPALCTGSAPLGVLDIAAFVVTAGAIAIETLADEQLRAFRREDHPSGTIMASGLWSRSRHPNYLGEIGFWWGLFLFALAAYPCGWLCIAGPLAINALFVFISIPMIDKRSVARRPAYAEHMKQLPGLLPRPWRKAKDST